MGLLERRKDQDPNMRLAAAFGTLIMNDDLAGVIKANEWCNRYGMDTISCGATIAFAMEAFEKGLITKRDTEGIDLTWGNIAGVIELLHKIAKKEGIGAVLSEGSREAAREVGQRCGGICRRGERVRGSNARSERFPRDGSRLYDIDPGCLPSHASLLSALNKELLHIRKPGSRKII